MRESQTSPQVKGRPEEILKIEDVRAALDRLLRKSADAKVTTSDCALDKTRDR